MGERGTLNVRSVRFVVGIYENERVENLEWLPDVADFNLQIRESDGTVTEHWYGYTCLRDVLRLLERLETRESGQLGWGTGLRTIRFNGDDVRVFGNPKLVGTVDDFRSATEDLVSQVFDYMRQHGVDTRHIATNLAETQGTPWQIDPVEVHDRLVE